MGFVIQMILGFLFHKSTGICTGDWPLYQLDLATIKENDR